MTEPDPRPRPDDEQPSQAAPDAVLYVRRGRTPTLGFWVVLSLLAPALLALIVGPFLGMGDLSSLFNLAMLAVLAIGLPLAALAALLDLIQERRRARRVTPERDPR